jgi:hypothetical protein
MKPPKGGSGTGSTPARAGTLPGPFSWARSLVVSQPALVIIQTSSAPTASAAMVPRAIFLGIAISPQQILSTLLDWKKTFERRNVE